MRPWIATLLLCASPAHAQEVGHALGGLGGTVATCALVVIAPIAIALVLWWRSRPPPEE